MRADTDALITTLGVQNDCLLMLMKGVQIWQDGNPKAVRELEKRGELLPVLRNLVPNLQMAQDMKDQSNERVPTLPDYEYLEMGGFPMHPPMDHLTLESID